MVRITSLARCLFGDVGRWIARKCTMLCYFSSLITVITVDAGRAYGGVCLRLKNGEGWYGVRCELRQFNGRQKDRLRGLAKHGWRASSLSGD